MNGRPPRGEEQLRFFATTPRPCSYLAGRSAVSVFADPQAQLSLSLYDQLAPFGFRRSGNDLYVPACPGCAQCVPVRVPVARFAPTRSQRRVWRRNQDLDWEIRTPAESLDLYPLYRDYLQQRHAGGGMDEPREEDYQRFLDSDWSETHFQVGRLEGRAVVVAVTDVLHDALSAVYTFYDTTLAGRSPGTLAILRQIEWARNMRRQWLYLGYWIAGSEKMDYKSKFRPLHAYRGGAWGELETDA